MEWAIRTLMKFQCCPVGIRSCRAADLIKRVGVEANIKIQETTILKRKMILNTQGCFVQGVPALCLYRIHGLHEQNHPPYPGQHHTLQPRLIRYWYSPRILFFSDAQVSSSPKIIEPSSPRFTLNKSGYSASSFLRVAFC